MMSFDSMLEEAVAFHGHMCPGQVLGVRMAVAGCESLAIEQPRQMGKQLVVFVEIDRCAADAIEVVTGCSLGKRTLKHMDYGKMAATFVRTTTGDAVRVHAREDARERVSAYAPNIADGRQAQIAAYRIMPAEELMNVMPVNISSGWLDRKRKRVFCGRCGEGINYGREVISEGSTFCRPCFGETYYRSGSDREGKVLTR